MDEELRNYDPDMSAGDLVISMMRNAADNGGATNIIAHVYDETTSMHIEIKMGVYIEGARPLYKGDNNDDAPPLAS